METRTMTETERIRQMNEPMDRMVRLVDLLAIESREMGDLLRTLEADGLLYIAEDLNQIVERLRKEFDIFTVEEVVGG